MSTAALALATASHAQSAPAAADDEIVVTAAPPEQQTLIDRKVYLVKNNAEAQTENALDVLRRVPSVTVTARDQIQLMGDSGVTVMVDGHPRSDGANALKTLPAAQIERIEVATNPSAAYPANAAAGVINIVTRHTAGAGLAGAATATVGSHGSTETKLAPSFAGERWTASASLDLRHDIQPYRSSRTRTAVDPASDYDQVRDGTQNISFFSGRIDLTYRPDKSHRWTLSGQHDEIDPRFADRMTSLSRGSDLVPASETTAATQAFRNDTATLDYNWTGRRQGESLDISADYHNTRYTWPGTILDTFDEGYQLATLARGASTETGELKLDYVHPMRKADTLSIGGVLTREHSDQFNGIALSGTHLSGAVQPIAPLAGTWTTAAAYATFQFPWGKWKIFPGLRAEERIYDVEAIGANGHRAQLLLFPSLHVDRKLAKRLDLTLSYSRRVTWPQLEQLDPSVRYTDPLDGAGGNPRLSPEITDTVETSLSFTPGKQTVTLKVFDRETADTFATAAQLQPGGISVTMPTNGGHSFKRGGELALQGPIWKGWRYSASTNLAVRHTAIVEAGGLTGFSQFAYSGNVQIEYQSKADGKPGANHLVFDTHYSGPFRLYEQRTSPWLSASLSWTHSFTKRLSAVAKISDLFASENYTTTLFGANYLQREREIDAGRRVMVSLVSRLGVIK